MHMLQALYQAVCTCETGIVIEPYQITLRIGTVAVSIRTLPTASPRVAKTWCWTTPLTSRFLTISSTPTFTTRPGPRRVLVRFTPRYSGAAHALLAASNYAPELFVHGDLRPLNFLMDAETGAVRIIDFDWAGKEGEAR